ncbi:MAG: PrsW family intramembrane metalloprotease [Candidatus Pacebacteria bacterium]|nr:PrsW family intramembrane metalloprotease [Candidatus Paceibacterota bacterium]
MNFNELFFAMTGGIMPALLWLWFWLKEDRLHPEPRRLLILTFLAGMGVVALALPIEQITNWAFKKMAIENLWGGFALLFMWALAEELTKYLAARKVAFERKDFDEPIDAIIYLITAALGFAAFENVIFLTEVVGHYGFLAGVVTSNLRFAGATLLHVLSSSCIGASIAFSFFHKEKLGRNIFGGLMLATLLHTFFNYFIIKTNGEHIFQIFFPLWLMVIFLLYIFEKVKKLKRSAQTPTTLE